MPICAGDAPSSWTAVNGIASVVIADPTEEMTAPAQSFTNSG